MAERVRRSPALERPEYLHEPEPARADEHLPVRLSPWRRLTAITLVRQASLLVLLALIWQAYGVWLDNDLILPSF